MARVRPARRPAMLLGREAAERMLSWWALVSVSWAECTFRADLPSVEAALGAAERSYATLDIEEFERATTEVDFVLACLEEPLPVALVVRLHRLRGLGSFADGDRDGALAALRSARVLDPGYVFPEEILPAGFELRVMYEALPAEASDALRLPRPRGGALWLDGTEGRLRPRTGATVFQRLESDQVVQTLYLEPSDPVPWYPGQRKRQTALLASAGGAAGVAAALYAAAWASRGPLGSPDPAWTEDDLQGVRARTNALTVGSAVAGAAALAQVGLAFTWGGR